MMTLRETGWCLTSRRAKGMPLFAILVTAMLMYTDGGRDQGGATAQLLGFSRSQAVQGPGRGGL